MLEEPGIVLTSRVRKSWRLQRLMLLCCAGAVAPLVPLRLVLELFFFPFLLFVLLGRRVAFAPACPLIELALPSPKLVNIVEIILAPQSRAKIWGSAINVKVGFRCSSGHF